MVTKYSQLTPATTPTGNELISVSQPSATVSLSASTISAVASSNTFLDSGTGFISAGFLVGDQIRISGWSTPYAANNIFSANIVSVNSTTLVVDADIMIDAPAGDAITITRWDSRRMTAQEVAALGGSSGGTVYSPLKFYYDGTGTTDPTGSFFEAIRFDSIGTANSYIYMSQDSLDGNVDVGDFARNAPKKGYITLISQSNPLAWQVYKIVNHDITANFNIRFEVQLQMQSDVSDFINGEVIQASFDMGFSGGQLYSAINWKPTTTVSTSLGNLYIGDIDASNSIFVTGSNDITTFGNNVMGVDNFNGDGAFRVLTFQDSPKLVNGPQLVLPTNADIQVEPGDTLTTLSFYDPATFNLGWKVISYQRASGQALAGSTTGAVTGPVTSTNNDIALFDGTTGNAIKDSGITISNDGSLASNSAFKVPTEQAVKTYTDNIIAASDAMVFKGVINASGNPNYPAGDRGYTYRISVAGKIGGASGVNVEAGDLIICLTDGTTSGTQASVGANWTVVQANLDGAVIGPATAVDNSIAVFDGTTGKLLKDSGISVASLDVAFQTHAATSKVTPVDADEFALVDSAAAFGLKKVLWSNIKATLKTYFDTLYTVFTGGTLSGALNEAPVVTLASASTVNIGAASANTINITGTNTITAFDSIPSGATRNLIFAGSLVLTHNGTSLILPTSANITTAAGDTAVALSLGSGNWKIIDYMRFSGRSLLRDQTVIAIAASDETTALTTGINKAKFINPFPTAFIVSNVVASLSTAQTSGAIFTVDINEAGTSILSTKLTIDNTETNSSTAATLPVISDTLIAAYAEIEVDIDQVGDGTAKGLKVYLIGTPL